MEYLKDTSNLPLISVIIPAFNVEKLIEKCLMSVENQTYPKDKLQIIAVDDGSTDSTGKIIDDLAKKYDNITAIHKENGGSSSARNKGLEIAKGMYISFVDSDDYIEKDMIEILVDAAIRNDYIQIVQIGRDEIAKDGTKLPPVVEVPDWETYYTPMGFLKGLLLHEQDSSFCTKLVDKKLFDYMKFPEGMLNEDFYLLYHFLGRCGGVIVTTKVGYHVYYRSGSNSRKNDTDKDYFPQVFTDIVKNSDDVLKFVEGNFSMLIPQAKRFALVQRLDYLLHIPISQMTKDNEFYMSVAKYVKDNKKEIKENEDLSKRQRLYLLLFTHNPRTIRKIHAFIRGIK